MSEEIAVIEEESVQSSALNLFGATEPADVIERAEKVATALKAVIDAKGLTQKIGQGNHVNVEGWTLLGSMLGVFPVCTWTRKLDDGWEARVEARTRSGEIVGAAEAECLRSESNWRNRDDFALRSMAQTRATSKALRAPLGFVVTLAGYEATPSEELRRDVAERVTIEMISTNQNSKIAVLIQELEKKHPKPEGQLPWVQDVRNFAGVKSRKELTREDAGKVIDWLEAQLEAETIPFG